MDSREHVFMACSNKTVFVRGMKGGGVQCDYEGCRCLLYILGWNIVNAGTVRESHSSLMGGPSGGVTRDTHTQHIPDDASVSATEFKTKREPNLN